MTGWWLSAFALALLRVEVAGRWFAARSAAGPSARWATVHGTIVCLNVSHDLFSPSVYSYKANQATQEDEWLTHTDKHTQTAQLSLLGEKQAGETTCDQTEYVQYWSHMQERVRISEATRTRNAIALLTAEEPPIYLHTRGRKGSENCSRAIYHR